ncbi:MAG: HAMP domain-containing histidine kinase [Proteobacteria bacterium]|nr:HAMP domain-containing histidine kinase [Pseudomonadota bacterium]
MNVRRLARTTSFRLTVAYAIITGLSFLVLFAIVYWSAMAYMREQIDLTVKAEIREVRNGNTDGTLDGLRRSVERIAAQSPGYFYLLTDRSGKKLAGNLPALAPRIGVREWLEGERLESFADIDIRGCGTQDIDGAYLFVGTNAHQVDELRESVAHAFLWGTAIALLIVLIGGATASAAAMRRVEAISRTSRDIVNGDLRRRIPLSGTGDEFDHLATSINAMLDRIGVLMEGLRQVSTDIAHDLRTPLTRLRQRLELAQQRPPDIASLHATLAATVGDIDGILQTFGALLRIAQIESGVRKAHFRTLDLSELLRTVVEIHESAIEEKGQSLCDDIAPGLHVRGDRELLMQLFANLVENASRHCPAGARIAFVAAPIAHGVDVVVADDGPGIPADMREKVLHRFVRLDASRTTPGNGLGLALVQAIATLHDATLELDDNTPGLRVRVRLA